MGLVLIKMFQFVARMVRRFLAGSPANAYEGIIFNTARSLAHQFGKAAA